MTWAPFPIAGGCYKDDTLPWSAQDTVNWIPVVAEVQGTRTPVMLRGAPGLSAVAHPGATLSAFNFDGSKRAGVSLRGAYNADGAFVVLQGTTLYRYNGDWLQPTAIGTVPDVSRVSITHNQITGGSQIVIANGTAGYVYNTADGTFTQITDDGFPGAKSVDYIDSYIVGVEPGGRFWFNSALADATSYNTLDRYEAEAAPDKIVGLIVSHSEVIVFGERTMEFFYDSGANTTTFQRRNGTQTEVGAASQFAIVKLDNTVYWLGNDGLIYRLDGYTPVRISLQPIEQQIARSDLSKCFAMVYEDRGHKIVYFTFPDGLTWGYDVATREWHRRKSYRLKRWRANTLTKWAGKWYAGDYTNGSLCTLEWGVNTENGAPLVAERTAAVMQNSDNRFRLNAVKLSVDGQKSAVAPKDTHTQWIVGSLPDATVGDTVDFQYGVVAVAGYTVSVVSGALPPGLSMDSSGHITGKLTARGDFSWSVAASDANGTSEPLSDACSVTFKIIANLDFNSSLTADSTGRVWTLMTQNITDRFGSQPVTIPFLDSTLAMERSAMSCLPDTDNEDGTYDYNAGNNAGVSSVLGVGAPGATEDFCVEAFVRPNLHTSTDNTAAGFFNFGGLKAAVRSAAALAYETVTIPAGLTRTTGVVTHPVRGEYFHYALTREGDIVSIWYNGTLIEQYSGGSHWNIDSTSIFYVGNANGSIASALGWLGQIDNVRMTVGWARYTESFTPPAVPYA